MEHETSVHINAAPATVWKTLAAAGQWPSWTESMTSVERLDQGRFAKGSRVRIKQPGLPAATWEVTSFEQGKAFTWESKTPAFSTSAGHRIVADGTQACTVHLTFTTGGPLAGLFALLTGRRTRRYLQMEADGLKKQCED